MKKLPLVADLIILPENNCIQNEIFLRHDVLTLQQLCFRLAYGYTCVTNT